MKDCVLCVTEYFVKFYIENIVLRISCGNTEKHK